jgi:hypothetical protein
MTTSQNTSVALVTEHLESDLHHLDPETKSKLFGLRAKRVGLFGRGEAIRSSRRKILGAIGEMVVASKPMTGGIR